MKKPVLFFSVADRNNFGYAVSMFNSLTKFHNPKDVDMLLITDETDKDNLDKLPKGIQIESLNPYTKDDPVFFYRQKPVVAEKYMDEYELVLGLDADQIITGSLDYIFITKDYDIGTVVNWNRADPQVYGFVDIARLGIPAPEYYNCGLVAMRSKKFVHHWKVLCFAPEFNYMQYKEQDVLNILAHFGNYNVRCFDAGDGVAKMNAWWGLIAKGELMRAEMRGDEIVIPKGFGDTPFPPADMTLKVIHAAGGNRENKMNYHTWVPEEVAKRIEYLISPTK